MKKYSIIKIRYKNHLYLYQPITLVKILFSTNIILYCIQFYYIRIVYSELLKMKQNKHGAGFNIVRASGFFSFKCSHLIEYFYSLIVNNVFIICKQTLLYYFILI